MLDLLLSEGNRLDICATDDSHFAGPDHFGAWVMVKAEDNSPGTLLAALKSGHHYSSQGPEFRNVEWNPDHVEIETSPVSTVIVQGTGSAAVARHGEAMTRTSIGLEKLAHSPWMRVTVVDRAGKRAWLNPVWS